MPPPSINMPIVDPGQKKYSKLTREEIRQLIMKENIGVLAEDIRHQSLMDTPTIKMAEDLIARIDTLLKTKESYQSVDFVSLVDATTAYLNKLQKKSVDKALTLQTKLYQTLPTIQRLQQIIMTFAHTAVNQPYSPEHASSLLVAMQLLYRSPALCERYLALGAYTELISLLFNQTHRAAFTATTAYMGVQIKTEGVRERLNSISDAGGDHLGELESMLDCSHPDHNVLPALIVFSEESGLYNLVERLEKLLTKPGIETTHIIGRIIQLYLIIHNYPMALQWYAKCFLLDCKPSHAIFTQFIIYHEINNTAPNAKDLKQLWIKRLREYCCGTLPRQVSDESKLSLARTMVDLIGQVPSMDGVTLLPDEPNEQRDRLEALLGNESFLPIINAIEQDFSHGQLPHDTFILRTVINAGYLSISQDFVRRAPQFARCIIFHQHTYTHFVRENLSVGWEYLKDNIPALVFQNVGVLNSILCGLFGAGGEQVAMRLMLAMIQRRLEVEEWVHRIAAEHSIEDGHYHEEYMAMMCDRVSLPEFTSLYKFIRVSRENPESAAAYLKNTPTKSKSKSMLTAGMRLYAYIHGLNNDTKLEHLLDFFGEVNYKSSLYPAIFRILADKNLPMLAVDIISNDPDYFGHPNNLKNHQMVLDIVRSLQQQQRQHSPNNRMLTELQLRIFITIMNGKEAPRPNVHLSKIRDILYKIDTRLMDESTHQLIESIEDREWLPLTPEKLEEIEQTVMKYLSRYPVHFDHSPTSSTSTSSTITTATSTEVQIE
ncbi:hypothetical protein SAMD00019534_020850 [Acytostelium subglobosum LB1]|uniref:hypothetical protein n=1 Tax=Acytostelium subglobosum LB1 TaxID=1410327 RepID=UPI000644E7E0|nr:hypothetical protein SAMD00019534_020850 [Acytostelium subglobosum LB1]GAM18910.1 hypothetical protein SAMD00019534_020850 [Acytostelium subglobosum LB1]|eukprot:XP_012758130.1 hypothetical protein SAMD00019534_020850 [Acytostelium subglobosum LB1]